MNYLDQLMMTILIQIHNEKSGIPLFFVSSKGQGKENGGKWYGHFWHVFLRRNIQTFVLKNIDLRLKLWYK